MFVYTRNKRRCYRSLTSELTQNKDYNFVYYNNRQLRPSRDCYLKMERSRKLLRIFFLIGAEQVAVIEKKASFDRTRMLTIDNIVEL